MSLAGKIAIVTGGSRGIGRGICIALAKAGADVVTCYAHGADGANETVALCKEYGVRAEAVQADVAKNDDVARMVLVAASWNFSFGRDYKSKNKRMNNSDSDSGVM